MRLNGLILAAGLSSRMGKFKPLLDGKGKTVIERTVKSMLGGGAERITVVLGYNAQAVENVLRQNFADSKLSFAYNDKYLETDMLYSIKCGLSALPDCDGFFLLPGDMPGVNVQTFVKLADAVKQLDISWEKTVRKTGLGQRNLLFPQCFIRGAGGVSCAKLVFPLLNGRRRHPPLVSSECIPEIMSFEGKGGLRGLWRQYEGKILNVPVEDLGCEMDLDTMDDYVKWITTLLD